MSQRSMTRAQQRRIARQQRRESLRMRRAWLVAGTALGTATFGVASAQAATFQVTSTADDAAPAACNGSNQCVTLRDAVDAANNSAGADTITFAPGLAGTIVLNMGGQLPIDAKDPLTITGPGASTLAVSGDVNGNGTPDAGDTRIIQITKTGTGSASPVSISGLTLKVGYDSAGGGRGGAIDDEVNAALTLTDAVVTNSRSDFAGAAGGGIDDNGALTLVRTTVSGNTAPNGTGGGIYSRPGYGSTRAVSISDSVISGNTALSGGGMYHDNGMATIQRTQITGNHATYSGYNGGGGLSSRGHLLLTGSTISGNTSAHAGGGLYLDGKYSQLVSNSVISGNTAPIGGGVSISAGNTKYTSIALLESTVLGNQGVDGAGVAVRSVREGNHVTINRSTLSGNTGGTSSFGGGLLIDGTVRGVVDVLDSTVSGNTATNGGGVSLSSQSNRHLQGTYNGAPQGTVAFDNSTIAKNAASANGGGIYLGQYDSAGSGSPKQSGTANVTSTIVSNNTAAGLPQDLDRPATSTSGGFDNAFSLIEQPGKAPVANQQTIVGVDPQLGPLANNGGPTLTQMPAGTSPVIDQGHADPHLAVDQRNAPRTVDTAIPNPPGGDGTDIGAVELPASAVVIPATPKAPVIPMPVFRVLIGGTALGGSADPLLAAGQTPVTCTTSLGSLTSCVIEVRALGPINIRTRTVRTGTLLGSGEVTSTGRASMLGMRVMLTGDGQAVMKARRFGIDATGFAVGSNGGSPTATGKVHLLGSSITLPLSKRSKKLSKGVLSQVDQAARLIKSARSVTCTAYTNPGKGDKALTKAEAKAACKRLLKDGVKGKVTPIGKGHAMQLGSSKTNKGRAADRRIVISFSL